MSSSSTPFLTRLTPPEVKLEIKDPVDPVALQQAHDIISRIQIDASSSSSSSSKQIDGTKLLQVAKQFGDISESKSTYIVSREECKEAFESLSDEERVSLENIHGRVKVFAEAQRRSVVDMEIDIPGGKAGHTVSPCRAAGCYAPGGRYPLPSSVIMTVATAHAAGCSTIILASPRPVPITLAAAYISGADLVLNLGGAQAIASMAYGVPATESIMFEIPQCDVIVGPGNKWVTAAKSIVGGYCGIDMLAGPSEVLVICDGTANVRVVASDLIAQAEHDVVARAILVSDDEGVIEKVEEEVRRQVEDLPEPNRGTAKEALKQSFAVLCKSLEECVEVSDLVAPEHLEVQTVDAMEVGMKCKNYGGLFVGEDAAEVLGDYGAGPNHTLPTGGTGRYTGGLSVFNFLRIRTYMRVDSREASQGMVKDSICMARLEGLEGHARAAEARKL